MNDKASLHAHVKTEGFDPEDVLPRNTIVVRRDSLAHLYDRWLAAFLCGIPENLIRIEILIFRL